MFRKNVKNRFFQRSNGVEKKVTRTERIVFKDITKKRNVVNFADQPSEKPKQEMKFVSVKPNVVENKEIEDSPKAFRQFRKKPQVGGKYLKVIFANLRISEVDNRPSPQYLLKQRTICKNMREKLMDWLIDVCCKFKLQDETMFLTANIVDRYLSRRAVSREKFQLVGLAALFIASKYEEIYFPGLQDLENVCAFSFTQADILMAEKKILSTINYQLTVVTPYNYVQEMMCCFKGATLQQKRRIRSVMKCLIDVSILKYSFLKHVPSKITVGAAYLAGKMVMGESFNYDSCYFEYYTGYKKKLAFTYAKMLLASLKSNFKTSSTTTSIRRKYSAVSRRKTTYYIMKIVETAFSSKKT